jgi:hypothetical protein
MRETNQEVGLQKRGPGTRHPKYTQRAPRRVLLEVEQLEGRVVPSTITLGASKDNTLYQSTTGNISNGAGSYFIAGETNGSLIRRGRGARGPRPQR